MIIMCKYLYNKSIDSNSDFSVHLLSSFRMKRTVST